jgi:hypothetical protein
MIQLVFEFALVYAVAWFAERREPAFVRSTVALVVSTGPRILCFLLTAVLAAIAPSRWTALVIVTLLFAIPVALLRMYLRYSWARCAFYGALGAGTAILSDAAMLSMR